MKFAVDLNQCENHGQCAIAAPNLFSLDDQGELSFRDEAEDRYVSAELSDAELAAAGDAESMCPMQAISLVD